MFWAGAALGVLSALCFVVVLGTTLKALYFLTGTRSPETGLLHWRSSWAAIPVWLLSTWSLANPFAFSLPFSFGTNVGISVLIHILFYAINHSAAKGNYRSG